MLISDNARRTRFRAAMKHSKRPLPKGAVSTGTAPVKDVRITSAEKDSHQELSSSSSSDDSDGDLPPLPRR